MRPTAGALHSRQIIVALVAIRHEISAESIQEGFGIVKCLLLVFARRSLLGGVASIFICKKIPCVFDALTLNILLFVPFGYLLPSLFPSKRWWQVILLGLAFSLTIELLQLITRLGYADVDDLINNTLGAAIGFLSYKLFLNSHVPLR